MKVVEHDFDSNPNCLEVIANAMGGSIDGNFIRGDNDMYKGIHLYLDIEEEIAGMLIDVSYKETLFLKNKNTTTSNEFLTLNFYKSNLDIDFVVSKKAKRFGKLDYNFLMMDGVLNVDYVVEEQTNVYCITIVIRKNVFREYIKNIYKIKEGVVFDIKKHTIVDVDRMNYQCQALINNFRKISPDSPYFEMSFKALTYALINKYLEQLKIKRKIVGKVVNDDIKRIISSRKFLDKNNEEIFPGIVFLAAEALMSVSKYKKLFTEIVGLSPAVYFYNSKLEKAKKLLETKQFRVREIANRLNYSSSSFLAKKFTIVYGVSPKEFQDLL